MHNSNSSSLFLLQKRLGTRGHHCLQLLQLLLLATQLQLQCPHIAFHPTFKASHNVVVVVVVLLEVIGHLTAAVSN